MINLTKSLMTFILNFLVLKVFNFIIFRQRKFTHSKDRNSLFYLSGAYIYFLNKVQVIGENFFLVLSGERISTAFFVHVIDWINWMTSRNAYSKIYFFGGWNNTFLYFIRISLLTLGACFLWRAMIFFWIILHLF